MKITVRAKLLSSFGSIAVILGITSGVSYYYMGDTNSTYSNLMNNDAKILVNTSQMEYYADHEVSLLREYFLMKADDDMSTIASDGKAMDSLILQTKGLTKDKNTLARLDQIRTLNSDYQSEINKVAAMKAADGLQYATSQQLFEFGVDIKNKAETIETTSQKQTDSKVQSTTRLSHTVSNIVLYVSILAFLFAIAIGIYMSWIISRPLRAVAKVASRIADGDLTSEDISVKNKDEIGALVASFNQMSANLRRLIGRVSMSAEQLAASSEELTASAEQTSEATQSIAVTMQELASGSEQQATSLDETAKTVQVMTGSTQGIAKTAHDVSDSARIASQVSAAGRASIETTVNQMKSIQATVTDLADVVKGLGGRSKEIGQIVATITNIAGQTELLALNAAIEAARAGDHGKGFSVVADEVRKLAEQSAVSAQQIEQIVKRIQGETLHAVTVTESTTHEVNEGIELVHAAGKSFGDIEQAVDSVAQQIQQVSVAVEQMAVDAEQMSSTIVDVSKVADTSASAAQNVSAAAQEQLATMEEVTASATSLSQMAEELQDVISQFKI